ncbi:MAG: hypothetical protein WDM96_17360 [Lacunisphaera sp.]
MPRGLFDVLPYDPDHFLISGIREVGSTTWGLFKINVRTGRRDPITSYDPAPDGAATSEVADNNGVLRARMMFQGDKVVLRSAARGRQPLRQDRGVPRQQGRCTVGLSLLRRRQRDALRVQHRALGHQHALHLQRPHRRWSEPLFHSDEGDVVQVHTSHDRTKFYGVTYETDKEHDKFFDAGRAKLQQTIDHSCRPARRTPLPVLPTTKKSLSSPRAATSTPARIMCST